MDRKSELERKRKKLEELRKARDERKTPGAAGTETADSTDNTTDVPKSSNSAEYEKAAVESLVQSLLGDSSTSTSTSASATPNAALPTSSSGTSTSVASDSGLSLSTSTVDSKKDVVNSFVDISVVTVPPKEIITYSKGIQTDSVEDYDAEEEEENDNDVNTRNKNQESQDKNKEKELEKTENGDKDETKAVPEVKTISEEEKQAILASDAFAQFFDRTSRMIERALNDPYDVTVNYSGGDLGDDENQAGANERVSLKLKFSDERWSVHRAITSMNWSPKHPETIFVGYNLNPVSSQDPDGVVLLWNTYSPDRPELVLTCQSAVMSTCLSKFHPNLVIGGTYSGSIVVWDTRTHKSTPVQRTPLTSSCHTHPVYCIDMVGTQNAHNLVSVSTDGKMCAWSMDMFAQPQESIDLMVGDNKAERHERPFPLACTSLSFPEDEINHFVVGGEDGIVGLGTRHGSKNGIQESLTGHFGPVTAVHCHSNSGNNRDFGDLILSSSMDWTVKLWSSKSKTPLHSFEAAGDYVYDVQWSPTHPSVFATVDGSGKFDLWNINLDSEVPTVSTVVESNGAALNRLKWSADGTKVAVGDAEGTVHLYDIGEKYSTPSVEESSILKKTLADFKAADTVAQQQQQQKQLQQAVAASNF